MFDDRGVVPLRKTFMRTLFKEDVQDFRQLRPGLNPPQVVVLFLCAERALHHCRPHLGKFLSNNVFPFLFLAKRPSSLHERCLYPILLAVVSVVGSGITGVSSHFLCFNSEQRLSRKLVGIKLEVEEKQNGLCFMEKDYLKAIASAVLLTQILDYFFSSRS